MTNLNWYERVVENLAQELYGVCELTDGLITTGNLQINTSKIEKHPTISVVVSFDEGEYFVEPIIIHFDPYNQEFYTLSLEDEEEVRIMLRTSDEIIDFIHNQIHDFQLSFNPDEPFINTGQFFDGNGLIPGGLFHEQLAGSAIEWFPNYVVTESFTKDDENLQQATTIRIGQFLGTETYVLGRVKSVMINGNLDSEYCELFPFEKSEIAVLKEVFKTL